MVGYMKRYDAGNWYVKEAVGKYRRSGELGKVLYCRNHGFCGDWISGLDTPMDSTDEPYPEQPPPPIPKWMSAREYQKYIGYLQQYVHNINLMRWFLEASDRAAVRVVELDEDGYTGITIFDMAGIRAALESGGITYYRWDEHTQIYFEHGWIHTWAPPLLMRNMVAEVEIYRGSDGRHEFLRPIPEDRWSWSYHKEAEHFIRSISEGSEFRSPGEDALLDLKLVEEVFKIHLKKAGR
jgi:predicted dehydrogenase